MPRSAGKKRGRTPQPPPQEKEEKDAPPHIPPSLDPPLNPLRTGMPAMESITGVEEFRKGKKLYRIIHTNEIDEYEKPEAAPKRKRKRKQ